VSDLSTPAPPADPAVTAPGAIVTDRERGGQDEDEAATSRPDDGEPSPVEEDDGAPAGEEAALAARERVAAERAEYARLLAEEQQARKHQMGLHKNKPDRDDTAAWAAYEATIAAAIEAVEEAGYAARVYLGEHPEAVPGEARRIELDAAAKEFGRKGDKVIPLWWVDPAGQCACPKAWECKPAGKHPIEKDWQKTATTDPQWWREVQEGDDRTSWYPQANIGIAHDKAFSLDEDPDNGGDITLEKLQERLGNDWSMPATQIRRTGSGGRHFDFLQPDGAPVGNMKLGQGLEIKGIGGLVVVPPSISGKGPYSFIVNADRLPAPQWLLDMIAEKRKQQRGEPSRISPEVIPTGRLRAYGKAAMARNAALLASCPEGGGPKGGRNNTLNTCAFVLGQLAAEGITNEDECRALLYEAASACGMNFVGDGVAGTFGSGWNKGLEQPYHPDWAEDDDGDGEEFPLRTWNQFGLGDRMVDRYADTRRWSPVDGTWRTWRSGQWIRDAKESADWLSKPMIESLYIDELPRYDDTPGISADGQIEDSPQQRFKKWLNGICNSSSMTATAVVARSHPRMRLDLSKCDANPLWINTRNGVYDAETESFYEHDPDQLLTMQAAVRYDPRATCPRWDEFFAQVQTEEDMRQYLYRVWGYSMTADFSEQAVFINHGGGANGKSVVMDVLSMISGDYGQVVPVETLLTSRDKGSKIPNDVARMKGKRFLKCSETSDGRRLDEALLKAMTGGEELVARFMRAEYFEFRPTGKVHLTSNFLGHIGGGDASWRRVHLTPWLITIPKDEQNKYLAAELYEQEAPGILNRLLAGLADWRTRDGLCPPDTARKAVEAYRKREDALGQAIAELFIEDMDHTECTAACKGHLLTRTGDCLWREYKAFAGQKAMERKSFYDKLEARGYVRGSYRRATMFPQLCSKLDEAREK